MFGSFSTVTLMEAVAFLSALAVAVIVAVPTPVAVILPSVTAATFASLVDHVTVLSSTNHGNTSAFTEKEAPL